MRKCFWETKELLMWQFKIKLAVFWGIGLCKCKLHTIHCGTNKCLISYIIKDTLVTTVTQHVWPDLNSTLWWVCPRIHLSIFYNHCILDRSPAHHMGDTEKTNRHINMDRETHRHISTTELMYCRLCCHSCIPVCLVDKTFHSVTQFSFKILSSYNCLPACKLLVKTLKDG